MAKPKAVLMIAPQPFLEPRGTPISVYRRILGLTALGHQVDLLTYHLGRNVNVPGLTIRRIPAVPWVRRVRIGPSWRKAVLDVLLFWKAFALLATRGYDVVHSHEEAAYFSGILASLFRKQHVYDMHSSLPRQLVSVYGWDHSPLLAPLRALERRTINTCSAVIVISDRLREYVKGVCQHAALEVIENVPLGLEDMVSDPAEVDLVRERLQIGDRLPIVYTGTLESYQGIDLLLDSASIVMETCPKAVFVIVGGTQPQIEYWQTEVQKRGLADDVLLVGSVPLGEVNIYLAMAEILVSPRGAEMPIPSKLYAYLHAGKPIVATAVGCHTEVLSEDTAILVEPDVERFAEALVRLLGAPELRKQLGDSAVWYYRATYRPESYLAKLGRVYQCLPS